MQSVANFLFYMDFNLFSFVRVFFTMVYTVAWLMIFSCLKVIRVNWCNWLTKYFPFFVLDIFKNQIKFELILINDLDLLSCQHRIFFKTVGVF